MTKKFAFVGSHNCGKTSTVWSVASELKKRGFNRFNVVPEVARFCPYPLGSNFISNLWMITNQITLEAQTERFHDVVICDRSVYDNIAYALTHSCSEEEVTVLSKIAEAWGRFSPYTVIFYFKPLTLEADGVRTIDPALQKQVDVEIRQVLNRIVPDITPVYIVTGDKQQRFKFVLDVIWRLINNEPKTTITC